MNTSDDNSKLVKRLAKSLPMIIFLFIVFACGFATLVLLFGNEGLECKIFALICFLAVLPLIGFIVFWVAKAKVIDLAEAINSNQKTLEDIQKILEKLKCLENTMDIINEIRLPMKKIIDSNSTKFREEEDFRNKLKTDIINEIHNLMENSSSKKTMNEIKEILELFSKINLGNK
jgi:hypothetical protein